MSHLSVQGEQSTTAEITALTNLAALATSGAGQFLRKTGATTFENATPAGGGGTIDGSGTTNEIAYWVDSDTIGALAVASYPSLTELSYVKGVTSAIQTQFNAKAPSTSPTFATSITGSYLTASEILITDGSKNIVSAAVATYPSLAELAYVKGVTSAIQTQLNAKAPSTSPTFATSITGSYLTASEILITDGSKNIVSAAVATYPSLAELAYVKGVTSAIQTQIGTKAAHATTITIAGTANQITSSAGAQDLSANRTWTLSLPADVLIPTVLTVPNTGLHLLDTNASHDLIIKPGSNITADRTFTITTGDTDMIVDFTAVTDEYVLAYDTGTNTWRGVAGGAGGGATTALDNLASVAINAALVLGTSDAFALGSATKQWSDLFLAEGGVINWDNGDMTMTQTGDALNVLGGNLTVGSPTLVTSAGINVKVVTGNEYNAFFEGTGGVVIPTIGFKHSSDTTGVRVTGDDTGFNYSNIGEGTTIFIKPGYPDAYWKTHGSSAAKFHVQSYLDGTGYLDSIVLTSGWCAFGHATPDRLTHAEVADTGTNTVVYASRLGHVTSDTATTAFGVGQEYELENGSGTNKVVSTQEWLFTDATNASEDADYVLKLMAAGTLAEKFRITSTGVVELITGANIRVNSANAKRTLILTAAGGAPTTTAGCSAVTQVESATNDVNYFVLDFDTSTSENAFWTVQMPDNYDGSTLTARFIWTNAAGLTTETVRWGIKARAYTDDDAIDQAWGTEVTVDDTWLAQNDVHISAASSAITPSGSPAGGQLMAFNVARKTASDNLTGDARLIAVHIEYGINAYSD